MTLQEINSKRKSGDIQTIKEISGIPRRTIEDVLYGKVKPTSMRGKEVISWFSKYISSREQLKGID